MRRLAWNASLDYIVFLLFTGLQPYQNTLVITWVAPLFLQLGLAVVVVESAVTSIYVCYAEDPSLIQRWDAEFFDQMSEALHQRLQYRSARAREVMNHSLDQLSDTPPPI